MFLSLGSTAWKKKMSPFSLIKKSGKVLGSKMIKKVVEKRMTDLPDEEKKALFDYF